MAKGEYIVFLLLLIFLAYGFIGREALVPKRAQVGSTITVTETEPPDMNSLSLPESNASDEKEKLTELRYELELRVVKIQIMNWIRENIDTMLLLKDGARSIEQVCFADVSTVYVEFMEDSGRKKWLLSLHNVPQGFFPEFKAFFVFENASFKLKSGKDTHKGIQLDCYALGPETFQLKQE